jgi:hypothetical protein
MTHCQHCHKPHTSHHAGDRFGDAAAHVYGYCPTCDTYEHVTTDKHGNALHCACLCGGVRIEIDGTRETVYCPACDTYFPAAVIVAACDAYADADGDGRLPFGPDPVYVETLESLERTAHDVVLTVAADVHLWMADRPLSQRVRVISNVQRVVHEAMHAAASWYADSPDADNWETDSARAVIGGFSNTSKMPGLSFSVHPMYCPLGSVLRNVPGTTCSKCYATRGMYGTWNTNVQSALFARSALVKIALRNADYADAFVSGFAFALRMRNRRARAAAHDVFRFHDAGDLWNEQHAEIYNRIAARVPGVRFWIPTRERTTAANTAWSSNVVVRVSAPKVDAFGTRPTSCDMVTAYRTSHVHTSDDVLPDDVTACPAPKQGGACDACRKCWAASVLAVSYGIH